MLYQQHAGAGSPTSGAFGGTWTTHLRQTNNSFKTTQNTVLARTPSGTPVENFLPYLGDYVNLMAVGNQFRGIFTANNTPAIANFPSGVVFQRVANFTTHPPRPPLVRPAPEITAARAAGVDRLCLRDCVP